MTPRDIVQALRCVETAVKGVNDTLAGGAGTCADPSIIDVCTGSVLETKLNEIITLLSGTEYDYEFVCTNEGVKIVQLEVKTGVKVIQNLDNTINTTAVIEPCSSSVESDAAKICIGGVPALMWVVKENGMPNGVVYYTDKEGQIISPPTPSGYVLGDCSSECNPAIGSGDGSEIASAIPFTSAVINKPQCCTVRVDTSVGPILMGKGESMYATSDFKCPINITGVTVVAGSCTESAIIIKLNRSF